MTHHLHVAAACNASYALALATMLASLTSNLGQSRIAHVYILQRDINDDLKKKIGDSINSERIKLCWINIDDGRLASLKNTIRRFDTVSLESYYRLLLPEMLPPNLDKVIYLDCDLVVTRDLGELWDLDVEGTYLLASPELLPTSRFVSSSNGIRLYRGLRLPDDLKFFNSGVMVINLRHWRDNYLFLRALIYILEAGQDLRWHDQEALNAVLAGEWRELDPTWNVTMHIFGRTLKPDLVPDLKNDPFIVHFNSAIKPWHPAQRFKSPGPARHFLSIHAATYNTFYHQRRLNRRPLYKELRSASFDAWKTGCGVYVTMPGRVVFRSV
jgi:lipopolysaccharide biosynthesis glycosyltransferase